MANDVYFNITVEGLDEGCKALEKVNQSLSLTSSSHNEGNMGDSADAGARGTVRQNHGGIASWLRLFFIDLHLRVDDLWPEADGPAQSLTQVAVHSLCVVSTL